ncbi:hypothetical protein [Aquibacillus saliphilus]|uniref:hypothetical protein n=1 Tax=Aquibacillus saliphilus TaxID=1909422 RepID=UPI001CF0C92B|nr:hypothetical protein [Aquibacillus saliphilus]
MFKFINKKLTNRYKQVPLLYITFDLNKYQEVGEKDSCELKVHPNMRDDEFIINQLNDIVDHIRDNYDMEKLSR